MKKFTHTHQDRLDNHQPTAQPITDKIEYQIITHWMDMYTFTNRTSEKTSSSSIEIKNTAILSIRNFR